MLLKLLPLDGCVSFRNTKVRQKKDRKSFWEQLPPFGKINIRGQTLSWRWCVGNHPTLYMTYSTGAQAWDSVFLQKLQRGEGYDASSWYTEMRFIVGRDSFPIHRSTGTSQFLWLRFPVEWKWGASLGMHMIGNNNVKLQGNVSAPYGISEALRVFCQCGAPFKKILVIRESKSKSIVRKNAEMVLVPLTGNVLRRTLASTQWSNLTMSGKSLVLWDLWGQNNFS